MFRKYNKRYIYTVASLFFSPKHPQIIVVQPSGHGRTAVGSHKCACYSPTNFLYYNLGNLVNLHTYIVKMATCTFRIYMNIYCVIIQCNIYIACKTVIVKLISTPSPLLSRCSASVLVMDVSVKNTTTLLKFLVDATNMY